MSLLQSRREFTASLSLAGTAALIGSAPALADDAAVRNDHGPAGAVGRWCLLLGIPLPCRRTDACRWP